MNTASLHSVDALVILTAAVLDGMTCILVPCKDYDAFAALPQVVAYRPRTGAPEVVCGKTGWNSDKGYAAYQSNAQIVRVVR